jgi:two-component system OmpR family sensor kinase
MSLRARLLLSLGALVAVALVVSGALVVGLTRAGLVEQLDAQLRAARGPDFRGDQPGFSPDDPTGRRIAFLVIAPDGSLVYAVPSGFATEPDPLPAVPPLETLRANERRDTVLELPAVDGSVSFHAVVDGGPGGVFRILAAPLTAVDEPIAALTRNLLLIGAAILVAIVVAGWFIIRQGLRPLERIADGAATIAAGDLSHRVDLPNDRTEVGRVGAAFDAMLDRIEASFAEERAALAEKERSERRLRQFVADVSHELRTPLTALRGYVDLYRAGGLEDHEQLDQAMGRIGTESRRMAALVEDLLLLARLDQGRPLRRDRVDLSSVVADAVADARALEPRRPIDADLAEGVAVTGDEDRLRQVVGNLFANVRVHTPADTAVSVALTSSAGSCRLVVADRGPGVDPAHAERIFDRFYRADPGRSRDKGGSGLGLSIAASVARAHGGTIAFAPTDGGGATFTMTLPVAEAERAS